MRGNRGRNFPSLGFTAKYRRSQLGINGAGNPGRRGASILAGGGVMSALDFSVYERPRSYKRRQMAKFRLRRDAVNFMHQHAYTLSHTQTLVYSVSVTTGGIVIDQIQSSPPAVIT